MTPNEMLAGVPAARIKDDKELRGFYEALKNVFEKE